MSELSKQVSQMLDLRELFLAAFSDACPDASMRVWNKAIDDRREFFWRLADDDESLVYGESRGDVLDIGENTFVEDTLLVWRPAGEDFVVVLVDHDVDGNEVVAILALNMELKKPIEGSS